MLIFTGIRVKNLRNLRLDRNIRRAGKRAFVVLSETETKTHADHELELPPETIALLDEFLTAARSRLPGSDSLWLFPGPTGGARSYSAMRDAVGSPLRKHAGIELSPHLYRHIIAKIVAERSPQHLHDVSRMLGHKRMNTNYESYLGTEGPAAANEAVLAATIRACAEACRRCGEECQSHAESHEHCRICAEACRRCAEACDQALSQVQ